MKRKLFYLFEGLQIKRSERIAISTLMVLSVLVTAVYFNPEAFIENREFDYSESDSVFARKSAALQLERETILQRYEPLEQHPLTGMQLRESIADTIDPDSARRGTNSEESTLININSASVVELQELPGIGPAYASRIVEWRNKNGAFGSKNQLIEIRGIGKKRLEAIRPLITL